TTFWRRTGEPTPVIAVGRVISPSRPALLPVPISTYQPGSGSWSPPRAPSPGRSPRRPGGLVRIVLRPPGRGPADARTVAPTRSADRASGRRIELARLSE